MDSDGHPVGDVAVDIDETLSLLNEMRGIKEGTRQEFRDGAWQWLLVWSAVCAGAAVSAFTPLVGWYWAFAVPVGLAVTALIEIRVEKRLRIRRKAWPYFAVGASIAVANMAVSAVFGDEVVVVGVWVVLGLGFAALVALDRIPSASALFIVLSLATLVAGVWTRDPFALYPVLGVAFAATLAALAGGIRWRMRA